MTTPTRSPVTQLLAAVSGGDAGAQDRLWSLIYDELRRLAQHQMVAEAPGHTLQPTALVHEAYFRLFGENPVQWSNRGHFFTAAAEAMRRIRVDDARIRGRLKRSGLWQEFDTDWLCLDCELMPWSAKAQELFRSQYAAVGAAARAAVPDVVEALAVTAERGCDLNGLLERYRAKGECASKFVDAYRQYCWPVASVSDLKLAPFHILASEGAVHTDKDHTWHMETLARLCAADEELLLATVNKLVDLTEPQSEQDGCQWWSELPGAAVRVWSSNRWPSLARGRTVSLSRP